MGLDLTGIGTAVEAVSGIITKFIPDPAVAMKAQSEITTQLIAANNDLFKQAADVAEADAKSEGWMTRNARPFTVFWSLFIITWIAILAPLFGPSVAQATVASLAQVPGSLWALLSAGIGAYPLLKMAENVVPHFTATKK